MSLTPKILLGLGLLLVAAVVLGLGYLAGRRRGGAGAKPAAGAAPPPAEAAPPGKPALALPKVEAPGSALGGLLALPPRRRPAR